MARRRVRVLAGAATALAGLSMLLLTVAAFGPAQVIGRTEVLTRSLDLVPICLGWLVVRGAPTSVVGPALAWAGTATLTTRAVEVWGLTATSSGPWPGSSLAAVVGPGFWPWQLMGFLALLLLFPDGLLRGRRWRVVALAGPAAALLINIGLAGGEPGSGTPPNSWQEPVLLVGLGLLLLSLGGALAGQVVRFRRGDALLRRQLRWPLLAAGLVPVLLVSGWFLAGLGVPGEVAYSGFLIGILVLVPAAIAVAVLREDLLDIDELISSSLAAVLTAIVSAGVFAGTVSLLAPARAEPSRLGTAGAAFVTALLLLPLYKRLHVAVGRVTDRERTVVLAAVREFVESVRDGTAQPEQVEDVLRRGLDDPDARLRLVVPGSPGLVDVTGAHADVDEEPHTVPLRSGDVDVGVLVLGRTSSRRRRLAIEAAQAARLPIEVSRLRLELRAAVADVTTSRSRLMSAVTDERRRLSRDLHDGAQQSMLAVGMRLRWVQHRLDVGSDSHEELDRAVQAIEQAVVELRRLAQGIRPTSLDDGLAAAVRALSADSPVPLDVSVLDLPLDAGDDLKVTTAYFVVAEAVANVWKHSQASRATVEVKGFADLTGPRIRLEIADDGIGGVDPSTALTALRDRVASVGGSLAVVSPAGGGTRITAVL